MTDWKTKEESTAATAALAGNNGFSLITDGKLLQLYTLLVKSRMIEERRSSLAGRNGFGANGSALLGREAAVVGVSIDLETDDSIIHAGENFVAGFLKGDPLARIFHPAPTDAAKPDAEGLLSNLIETAVSAAQTHKVAQNGRVAAVFAEQSAGSSAIWLEAITRAATDRLPILFVCQTKHSNGTADSEMLPISAEISRHAAECGIPAIPVDGCDLVAIYRVATEALTHARKGNGATWIGCGHGDSIEADPIPKMEAYLSRKGLFSENLRNEIAAGFGEELDVAVNGPEKATISA